MQIRSAERDDLEAIRSLLTQAELPEEGVAEHLASFLVAERGAALLGVAGLEIYADVALIRSVAVASEYRRQGLGEQLCQALLERATELDVDRCYLLTETAERFFAARGFRRVERSAAPPAIQNTGEFTHLCPESAALMTRKLS